MPLKTLRQCALTACFCLAAMAASAGPASDLIFSEGVFEKAPDGSQVLYDHSRIGAAGDEALHPINEGEVQIDIKPTSDGGREAVLTMRADGRSRELNPFPAQYGNPILMTFLESSLRAMARVTGGSPFYIRNRMKEALRTGGEIAPVSATLNGAETEAQQATFRPFAKDKNRAKMGAFGDLELRFVFADSAPGGFLLLSASTGGAEEDVVFEETIAFREMKTGG